MLLWNIFVAFVRPNLLGYGGGPAVVPLIEAEVVDTFHWLTSAEFADALAIGNTLPGPIATTMAGYIGFKVGHLPGALVALAATVVPTVTLMIILYSILYQFRSAPVVQGMIKAAKPVVFVLFVLLALDFFKFVWPPQAGWGAALVAVGAFVAIYYFGVHQAVTILAALIIGAVAFR